jgi:hypothetical protein
MAGLQELMAREVAQRAEAKQQVVHFIVDGPEDEEKVAAASAAHTNAFTALAASSRPPFRPCWSAGGQEIGLVFRPSNLRGSRCCISTELMHPPLLSMPWFTW